MKKNIKINKNLFNDILILDESTSSLDNYTEKKVIDSLFKLYKNKTIIFITHKENLIKRFDKVFLLKNRRLIKTNSGKL